MAFDCFVPGGGFSDAPIPTVEVKPVIQSGYAQFVNPPLVSVDAGMGSNGSFLADTSCSCKPIVDTSRNIDVPQSPVIGGNGSFVSFGMGDDNSKNRPMPTWIKLAAFAGIVGIILKMKGDSNESF